MLTCLSNKKSKQIDEIIKSLKLINKGTYAHNVYLYMHKFLLLLEGISVKEKCSELREVVASVLNALSSNDDSCFYSGTNNYIFLVPLLPPLFFLTDFQELFHSCNSLCDKVSNGSTSVQFEWVNSLLVTALTHGYWLLITQANFCR